MKVNLQLSVDIDRVPDEIHRLIIIASRELHDAAKALEYVDITDGNPYYANEGVDKVRQTLVPIDTALEEIQVLIAGYQSALTEIMSASMEVPEEGHAGTLASPSAETIAGWDKSLTNLREQLGGSDDENNNEEG